MLPSASFVTFCSNSSSKSVPSITSVPFASGCLRCAPAVASPARLPHNFLQIRFGLDMLPPPALEDCPSITLNPNRTKSMLPAKMDILTNLVA